MGSQPVGDSAARRCPPPDTDTDPWATRPTLGRPDSAARPWLSDSSLSQLREPDPRGSTEDERRCKPALLTPVTPVARSSFFVPTSITLREETAAPTQINILKIIPLKPRLGISSELNAANVSRFVGGLLTPALRSACGCHVCSRLLHFALSIFNESRRGNYALVASVGSQAGEKGEGASGTYQPFQKQQQQQHEGDN